MSLRPLACFCIAGLFLVVDCAVSIGQAHDEIPGAPQTKPIALTGGTIHPVASKPITNGTILFDEGKIVGIGKNIDIPENAKVIRVEGKHIFPGLFEAHSQMGLIEIGAVSATDDRGEIGQINPNVKAIVAVNPESEIIPVTRSNGVLLALSAPAGYMVSGKSSVIQLDGWTYEDLTVKSDVAMNIVWPRVESAIEFASNSEMGRSFRAPAGGMDELRKLFEAARAYARGVEAANAKGGNFTSFKHDLRLEAMIPVLEGTIPIMAEANDLQQIQSAVAFAVEQEVRLIIFGGYDAPLCADLLKEHQVPVVLSAVYRMPRRRDEDYDAAYTLPAKLQKLGVQYCISGSDRSETWNARILPDHAGTAVAYGLEEAEALKAITLYPAEILGVDRRVGSLEVGKDATLFVSSTTPLDITNQVEMAWIQGRTVELNDRHKQLYRKYQEKYKQQRATN